MWDKACWTLYFDTLVCLSSFHANRIQIRSLLNGMVHDVKLYLYMD